MRRPRLPEELCERIDAARGNTPFERYVRELLTRALRDEEHEAAVRALGAVAREVSHEAGLPHRDDRPGPPPVSQTWRR